MTRLLPPAEWPKLAGTLLEPVWPTLEPEAQILVQEDADGAIVACVALFQAWHLEGLWLAPRHRRRVGPFRRFVRAVRALVGRREVMAMALTADAERLCQRAGQAIRLDCAHFAVRF